MFCMVFRRVGPALRACGSLRSLAAASRPLAISPNIIVFIVHSLTFMNVSALVIGWTYFIVDSVALTLCPFPRLPPPCLLGHLGGDVRF